MDDSRATCPACGQEIYGDSKCFQGFYWHQQCFRCSICHNTVDVESDDELMLLGDDHYLYHRKCFLERREPKCDVCHQLVPANEKGKIRYMIHPFWLQKSCPSHTDDNTPECSGCERLVPRTSRHVTLKDGRSLCTECHESAIMDSDECQPLYHSIRDYFQCINMKIDQQIPMLLVEAREFIRSRKGEKQGDLRKGIMGMCVSKERIIKSVHRTRKIRKNRVLGWEEYVGMESYPRKLREAKVTGILVLFGLPRLFTGAILAHELMHAWLRLNNFRKLNPKAEEGICELVAHMWLESQVIMPKATGSPPPLSAPASSDHSPSSNSSPPPPDEAVENSDEFEKRLGEFYMFRMGNRAQDDEYSEGFRAAQAAVKKFGLGGVLRFLEWTRSFPVPLRSAL